MAKFCTKCGSPLEDGKCPKCKEETKKETKTTTTTTETVDVKESFMDCLNIFKKIFTKPFEAIKEFVCDNKFVSGIIMIVATAISTGLYKIATLKNIFEATSGSKFNSGDLGDYLNAALSGGSFGPAKPDYVSEFFKTFAYSLVEYAAIALIGYLIVAKLFKGTATVKQMITTVGIALSVVLLANLANSIIVFFDGEVFGYIRSYISMFGTIFMYLILYEGIKEVGDVAKEKLYITVASICICATIVIDIAHKMFD